MREATQQEISEYEQHKNKPLGRPGKDEIWAVETNQFGGKDFSLVKRAVLTGLRTKGLSIDQRTEGLSNEEVVRYLLDMD